MVLYFSNSSSQTASDIGGSAPVTGFHSVMLSPLSVSRVRPPTAIIRTTSVNSTISQTRMPRRAPRFPASIMPPRGISGASLSALPTSSKMLRFPLIMNLIQFG